MNHKRAFLVVLDACGVGAMPDWKQFDDPAGTNTLGHVAAACGGLNLPNLQKLGLGNITNVLGVPPSKTYIGSWGKASEVSMGKDTTTGHWEMAGLIVEKPFPVYPGGFPKRIIDQFVQQTGCGGVLCNEPASGTEVLERLGQKHLETGWPIVYTSADSVFQIATNVEKIPLETLYRWCEIAREILRGEHEVSRVIARPFSGKTSREFRRLSDHRHDYAIEPRGETLLTFLSKFGVQTLSVGKINDIFCGVGVQKALDGKSNEICLQNITGLISEQPSANQLVFANLVETDSHFGHRNDPIGFGEAITKIDAELRNWLKMLGPDDLLILTADHGCDPTRPGTDHTREYVPILAYSPNLKPAELGIRQSFADTAATVADWLGFKDKWQTQKLPGESYLN
jgi:phosphopentomutase